MKFLVMFFSLRIPDEGHDGQEEAPGWALRFAQHGFNDTLGCL